VDRTSGQFAHGECPVSAIDVERLESLAQTSWFWQRFQDRLQA
jgi:hypothetical protein